MFEINDNLREKVLSSVRDDYTPRQKVIAIYKSLCETLNYSIEYYIDEPMNYRYFANPDNLRNVDGQNNKNIVCYTFSAIMYELVDSMRLDGVEPIAPELTIDDWFDAEHACFHVKIDGDTYEFDSLDGVITHNDMIAIKYGEPITGIKIIETGKTGSEKTKLKKSLDDDIYKVCSADIELSALAKRYKAIKGDDYFELSLEERYKLFLTFVQDVRGDISINELNYILRLKQLLFKPAEITTFFDVQFLNDVSMKNKRIFLFYNPKGYRGFKGRENFESLSIHEYRPQTGDIVQYTREELLGKNKENERMASLQGMSIVNHCRMVKEGMSKESGYSEWL